VINYVFFAFIFAVLLPIFVTFAFISIKAT